AANAMAQVEKEGLALLLAIVADIDSGLDLLVDDPAKRRLAEAVEFSRVDRAAAGALDVEPGQLGRARQAAGMRRQDAVLAPLHRSTLPISGAIARPASRGRERPR